MKNKLFFKKLNSMLFWSFALFFLLVSGNSYGQVYKEDFGNNATVAVPYTSGTNATGSVIKNTNLGTPSWNQNLASTNFAGNTLGAMSATTGISAYTITCTFTVANGFKLTPTSVGFDNRGSSTGPNALTITISGTGGSTSCSPTPSRTGAFTTTAATSFASTSLNLTGTVTFTFAFTGGASGSTERLDNIILNGTVAASNTSPTAPTIGTITPGNGQLSVAFTVPSSDGGAAISNYQYSTDGGTNYIACSPVQTTSPIVITGLLNGTSYAVLLKAVNSVGAGSASTSVSGTPRTVPSTSIITGITPGNGNLSVAFTPGSDGGATVTNYKYSLNGGSSFAAFSPAQTTSPVSISGLTNGTVYTIQLVAVNAAGDGTASSSFSATPFTTPSAVTDFAITEGNSQLSLAFTAGANGGSAITNYEYSLNGGSTFTSAGSTTSPIVVTGLTNGTSYSVQLRAVNAAGNGVATSSVSATPRTISDAPSVTVITAGNSQLSVAFSAPAFNGGAAITNYKYSLNGSSSFVSTGTTSSPILISGLTNGTTYDVQLLAVNIAGDGIPSSTVQGTPIAPSSPTLSASKISLNALSTIYGTVSTTDNFDVSGGSLSGNITVTAPTGFEVSTTSSFAGFASSQVITQTSGVVASTTVYVRLKASASAVSSPYSGDIVISSLDATNVNVATTSSSVTVKGLTISGLTGVDKTYDASLDAAVSGTVVLNGIVGSDDVAISGTPSYSFIDANAGTAKSITVSGYTITGADAANYSVSQPTGITATINKANQTIILSPLPFLTYSPAGTSVLLAFSSSNLPIVFSSSNTTVASVSGDILSIISAGSTIITASQAGNNNYNAATSVTQTVTIAKANQTITLAATDSKTTATTTYTLTANSSAGLVITYSSSNTSVATIIGNTVTIQSAGTTTITANQAGNDNYNAAPQVTQVLTVIQAPVVLAGWDFSTQAGGPGLYGTSPLSVNTNNTNVTIGSLTRGSGFGTMTGTAAAAAWGATNFTAAGTLDGEITANKYYSFTITPNTGKLVSLVNIAPYNIRRSSSGPTTGQWQYQINNGSFVNIGSAITWGSGTSSSGNAQTAIDLTGIADLTSVPSTSVITIRLVSYGASGTGGTNYLKDLGNLTENDLIVNGFVSQVPAPSITSSLTANGTVGSSFTYATAATNSPSSYAATGLPSGLSINTSTGAISGTPTTVGSSSVTLSATNATGTDTKTLVITVGQGTQAITFGALAPITYGATSFSINGASSSGLTLSYSSSNTAVATISGNTVTILGAGSTSITASQSGDANYFAATDVSQDLVVAKANQTITFNTLPAKNDVDGSFTLGATASSGLTVSYSSSNTNVVSIIGNTVTILAPGTSIITASQAGNANYNPAISVDQEQTIINTQLSNQTITFGPLSTVTYGDASFTLNATVDSPLTITYISSDATVASISGNIVSIIKPGIVTITASQAGNSSYNAAPTVNQTLTINQKTLTVSGATATSRAYDATNVATITGATLVGVVGLDIVNVSGGGTFADASPGINKPVTPFLTLNGTDASKYSLTQPTGLTATISQAAQTITFAALANKTTADLPFALTAISTSGLSITYTSSNTAVATVSGNTVTIVGAGTTTITASQIGDVNYSAAANVDRTFTVITVATPILSWNTFGNAGTETTEPSSSNNANIASATLNYTGSSVTTAANGNRFGGSNWAVGALSTSNYIQFTVTPNTGYVFTPTSFDFIWDFSSTGPKSVTLRSSADGYVSDLGSLTTMTASTSTVKSISISGLTNISASTTFRLYGYDATAAGGTGGFDCASSANNVVLNGFVNQLPAPSITSSLTANGTVGSSFTYATAATNSPSSYAATGLPSGLSINTSNGVISGTPTAIGSSNVSLSATNATGTDIKTLVITVGQGTQAITFGALDPITYGATSFSLNGASSSGLPLSYSSSNTAVAAISGNTVTIIGAGTTSITASQIGNDNYLVASDVSQTLTVNKAGQIITFNSLPNKLDTDAPFTLGATSTSSLAVSFSSSNSAVISISGTTATIVGAGTATITASQGGDNNYLAATNSTQNQLVVSTALANQSITFGALNAVTYGDGTFNLTATGGASENPVTYSSSDQTIASISGNVVSIIKPGTVTITASQAGNSSYNAAPSVDQTLTINQKTLTVSNVVVSDKTYDGLLAAIISSDPLNGLVGTDVVSLSNAAVFTDANVGNGIAVTPNFTLNGVDAVKYLLTQPTGVSGNIIAGNQTITFTALPPKTFGDAAFNLIAIGGASGNAVTFVSSNPAIASITGNTVTILAGGTVTITASQSGSLNYNAASDVTQSLIIAPKTQTITLFNPLGLKHLNESSFNLGAVASSGGIPTGLPVTYVSSNTDVATISGSTVTLVGVGLTTITATQAGNNNYLVATLLQTLKVITPAIAAWNVSSLNNTPTATATTFVNLDATNNLMTRGSTALASTGGASFRTTGFKNEGIATTNTDYFQVTLKPIENARLSIATIDATFNGTASYYVTPGVTSQFAYSLNGTDFTLINSPVQSSSLTMATVDVSGISALQNVLSSTTVTLRYYASGQTTTGGWGFFSPTATSDAFSIGGQVILNTTPSPIANNQDFCGSGTVANLVAVGTDLKWYTAANGGAPLTSDVALVSGNYYVTQTINGFESLLRTQVLVSITPSSTNTTTTSAVGTYTWANNGLTYTSSGVYTGTTINCVTQVLNLTITPLTASLSLQMFLDGYYIYGSNPASMRAARYNNLVASVSANPGVNTDVDVITVELRSAASLAVVAYSVSPILQKNGSVQCTFPVAAYGNSYYVVVKHRSSLPLWSANPITISGSTALNFANSITNAYTLTNNIAPMKTLVSGLYASRLGELNDDGYLDAFDYAAFQTDLYSSAYGSLYLLDGDLNGDSYVDASDYAVFDFNSRLGSIEQRPY